MIYQLSPKITLTTGDKIRITGGPYYITKSGTKIGMGEKGIGEFVRYEENTQEIVVKLNRDSSLKYVYMGIDKLSENTGTFFTAHKITKIKTRKIQSEK